MKLHKSLLVFGASVLLLIACGNNGKGAEEIEESNAREVVEEVNIDESDRIEEVEFVPFEDNEEAQEIANGAILGDDPEMQASFATLYLNHSYDGMFEFKENNEGKIIVGYPVNEELEERIMDFRNGDIEIKQSFYDTFSEVDFQFLGALHGIDDDYEIHILDDQNSENKLIIFDKNGYVYNAFAN